MENLTKQIKELKEELNKLYAEQQIILKYLNVGKLNEINTKIYKLRQEIKRVNTILRNTKNPNEYRQNKKYLERLERKLRAEKSKF